MCSGRELLIIGIVEIENEHLRKMGIALHASRTNRACGVNSRKNLNRDKYRELCA